VSCSADIDVSIEFDRLSDGRYVGWAVVATHEPVSGAELLTTRDGDIASTVVSYPSVVDLFGHRLAVLHECSTGGGSHDRSAVPDPPPGRRTWTYPE